MKRDPRKEPKVGDVLLVKNGGRCERWTVTNRDGQFVFYTRGKRTDGAMAQGTGSVRSLQWWLESPVVANGMVLHAAD